MGATTTQLATASLIGQIGGGLSSGAGAYYGTATQRANFQGQAALAEANARNAERSAQSTLAQGNQEAAALTLKAGQLKGRQRAALAAGGVDLGVGSAAEIQASTDVMKEIDTNTLLANATRTAWGHRTQATNYQNEALAARANAKASSPGAALATSLLGSATKVASSWYAFNKAGVFDEQNLAPDGDPIHAYGVLNGWWNE
ncbi:MAG: hypothetical protein ACK5NE_09470 [Brachymonas sp.]